MTLYAVLTESAGGVNQPSPTLALLATDTLMPTALPTNTMTPVASQLPSVTASVTAQPIPCYRAEFIKDVTIPDDYDKLAPGETFVKTWRLGNNGSCSWPANLQVVFVSSEQMGGPDAQAIGQAVAVGATVDISVTLKAPAGNGRHVGYWMLRAPDGTRFGLGNAGDQTFWVQIIIGSLTPSTTVTQTAGTPLPTNTPTPTSPPTPTRTPTPTATPTMTPTMPNCGWGPYPAC
jgi:hypothetical protein